MDLWQFTPLHEAASKNRVEVCSLLLSHGADPTLVNCHGKSAVDMAPTPELRERLTCMYFYPEINIICCKMEYLIFVQLIRADVLSNLDNILPFLHIYWFIILIYDRILFLMIPQESYIHILFCVYSSLILIHELRCPILLFKANENESVNNHLLTAYYVPCTRNKALYKSEKKLSSQSLYFYASGYNRYLTLFSTHYFPSPVRLHNHVSFLLYVIAQVKSLAQIYTI